MGERKSQVFLVATASQIDALPPALPGRGRFAEIFFVDLPDAAAREQLFAQHLERRALEPQAFDLPAPRSDGRSSPRCTPRTPPAHR